MHLDCFKGFDSVLYLTKTLSSPNCHAGMVLAKVTNFMIILSLVYLIVYKDHIQYKL